MTTYDYGTAIDDASAIVNSFAAISALEALPPVTITFEGKDGLVSSQMSAAEFKHMLNNQVISSKRTISMEDNDVNRLKHAKHCESAALKGEVADSWETWSRRGNSIAFVLTHKKDKATGIWHYNKLGEVMLRVQQRIVKNVDIALEPISEAISEAMLESINQSVSTR
jgi:hypothetical protein